MSDGLMIIRFRRRPPAVTQIASGRRHLPEAQAGLNGSSARGTGNSGTFVVAFDRHELYVILGLYGRMVAAGEWRDYALDFTPTHAVFSIFRRSTEVRSIESSRSESSPAGKVPIRSPWPAADILKRGHDLARVISVLDKRLKVVT